MNLKQTQELMKGCMKRLPSKQRQVTNSLVCDKYQLCKECKKEIKIRLEDAEDFLQRIEELDIELMFTDIKDKKGKKFELSDEFMEIISLWWDKKSLELSNELREIIKELNKKKVKK